MPFFCPFFPGSNYSILSSINQQHFYCMFLKIFPTKKEMV
nr:MAG TPA: hypothetical protein [Caudoviricetes sp.]